MDELDPLTCTVVVARPLEAAFAAFVDEIGEWWPAASHSVGGERVATVVFEGRLGGRIFEQWEDGTEILWGEVTTWDPPHLVGFWWKPVHEAPAATDVEVRFAADAPGLTRVVLVHRGWERLGERADESRASYVTGWAYVLGRLTAHGAGTPRGRVQGLI